MQRRHVYQSVPFQHHGIFTTQRQPSLLPLPHQDPLHVPQFQSPQIMQLQSQHSPLLFTTHYQLPFQPAQPLHPVLPRQTQPLFPLLQSITSQHNPSFSPARGVHMHGEPLQHSKAVLTAQKQQIQSHSHTTAAQQQSTSLNPESSVIRSSLPSLPAPTISTTITEKSALVVATNESLTPDISRISIPPQAHVTPSQCKPASASTIRPASLSPTITTLPNPSLVIYFDDDEDLTPTPAPTSITAANAPTPSPAPTALLQSQIPNISNIEKDSVGSDKGAANQLSEVVFSNFKYG